MRVLITGANGFVGSFLARRLAARGDDVRCLVRRGSDASALDGAAVTLVEGDVTDAASLRAALEGVEVCQHLAGIRRASTREGFLEVNAHGTQLVAEAMVATGAKRLVLCSSLAASGSSTLARPRREDDPLCPEEWYGESKAEAERLAFSYAGKLEVTAIRPSRIVGPGDRENLTFFKLAARGVVLRILGAERRISMVDVDDVVDQLVLQGEHAQAVGEAFFCSSEESATVEMLMRLVAEALQIHTRTLPVPERALSSLGAVADVVSNLSGKKLPLNRKLAKQLLAQGWTCSTQKAKERLGFVARRGLRESITRSAQAYREAGWL